VRLRALCDEVAHVVPLNLLDRHIFKSVLFTCLGAVGLFAFVVALANFVRDLLGPLLAGQIGIGMLIRLILLLFPYAVVYALPMGILTGVLLTLGRLSADSEITAMRAAGIGVIRIAQPVFILGLIGAATALYANFQSMPWSRVQYHREFAVALRANPLSFIVPKTFIRDFKGFVVYVEQRDDDGTLHHVSIWKLDNQSRVISSARADSARIEYDEPHNSMVLVLNRAIVTEPSDPNPEDVLDKAPHVQTFQTWSDIRLPLDQYLAQNVYHVKPEWLTYDQLQQRRTELAAQKVEPEKRKESAIERMKLAIIYNEKVNLSIAVFAFAFVAVPLGIKVSRRETSANLGVAVLLVLSYYLLITLVKSLDQHPEYRPDLLLWVPNLLFFWFGFSLLRRVER
jgi:lipopolysaccharide export system permease protein